VEYTTEEQQAEAIKKWWRENGKSVVTGLIVGLAGVLGWQQWTEYRERRAELASAEYQQLLQELNQENLVAVQKRGAQVVKEFARSPYAVLASLAQAKAYLEKGDAAAAIESLRWVVEHSAQDAWVHIARLRWARILLSEGRYDEARGLIEGVKPDSYVAAYEELKGDISLAVGEIAEARSAYGRALAELEPSAPNRNWLQMKIDDLSEPSKLDDAS
jgi:predicted negative regulator of RcsB-dependent stress response